MVTFKHLDLVGPTHPQKCFWVPILMTITLHDLLTPTPKIVRFTLKYWLFLAKLHISNENSD